MTQDYGSPGSKKAFTLIELLVVISIIAVLIGILLPVLSAARESSRETKCKANLKSFGMGFLAYANANGDYLCSGAFDPHVGSGRDGPVDLVGWVADLVNSQNAFPGQQLCPSNPSRYNQKLGANGGTYTAARAARLVERGYNTNYTQSWYMGRTEWNPASNDFNLKKVKSTFGGLNLGSLRSVDSARVPLLGDGRTDPDDRVLGERAVKTMTDGPHEGPYGVQSFADFGPAHGRAGWIGSKNHDRIRASVLFADGHAGSFQDLDRDGEFALDESRSPADQKDLSAEVFDGVLSLGKRSTSVWERL